MKTKIMFLLFKDKVQFIMEIVINDMPTPVSALIHAATMVTAGVFLLIRVCFLIELTPEVKKFILVIGAITALFAGSVGTVQMDLKKVIAYSTCSQLGFMVVACGLGAYDVALFHLAMHAFFKALLFLSAGSIIHAFFYDEQDIRRIGGAFNLLPVTYISFLIGSLALMGFPFLSGYYSKDTILELLLVSSCPISKFASVCCFLAVICTTFYSTRLLYYVFFSTNRLNMYVLNRSHESSYFILIPLILLSIFSVFSGFFLKDTLVNLSYLSGNYKIGLASSYILYDGLYSSNYYLIEELSALSKLFSFFLVIAVVLITLSYYLNKKLYHFVNMKFMNSSFFLFFYRFLEKKWYFDIIYAYFSRFIINQSYYHLMINWDRGFLEFFGPYGFVLIFKPLTDKFRSIQNGSMENYLLVFVFVIIFMLGFIAHYFLYLV